MRRAFFAGVIFASTIARADNLTPGSVALSLESADRAPIVRVGLKDADPRTRAAAARVVAVTNASDLIEDVRTALATEANAEAAREEIRALGMSGGVKELDFLLAQSKRFSSSLDSDVWNAVSRGSEGLPAIDAFLAHDAGHGSGVLNYALWGHPELTTTVSTRVFAKGDPILWRQWLRSLATARSALDPSLAALALKHDNAEIRDATLRTLATKPAPKDPKLVLEALDAAVAALPNVNVDESYKRELLARALGRKPRERNEWTELLKGETPAFPIFYYRVFLTRRESAATIFSRWRTIEVPLTNVPEIPIAPFSVMSDLPKGVAAEVLDSTGCRGEWIGFASVDVDRAGRVRNVDVSRVETGDACKRALNVLVRMSTSPSLAP
jgi:hypothetical protein